MASSEDCSMKFQSIALGLMNQHTFKSLKTIKFPAACFTWFYFNKAVSSW